MLYHPSKFKGISDGIKAFEVAKKKYPDIMLVMFGIVRGRDVPQYVEFHERPTQHKLREIYSSCDIFLSPSHLEGFNLCPVEAMACKCATILTDVGAVHDYAVHGTTSLICAPGDVNCISSYLIRLLRNEEELKRLSMTGFNFIKNLTVENAVRELESTFMSFI